MKITIPVEITTSDIVSTNVAITETLWDNTTTYVTGNQRYKGNFLYESAVDSNVGNDPEVTAGGVNINNDWLNAGFTPIESPKWLIVGMINKMKMFDGYTSTYTSNTSSIDTVIKKTYVSDLYLLGLSAATIQVYVLDSLDIVIWDSGLINMLEGLDLIDNMYDYDYSEPPDPRAKYYIPLGVTTLDTDKIRIVISGSGTVKCGKVVVGHAVNTGVTQWGLDDGFNDWSKNISDGFGDFYLKQGNYNPELNGVSQILTILESDAIMNLLIKVRATGVIVDLNEGDVSYESLMYYCVISECRRSLPSYGDTKIKFKVTGLI
jgi:hypothetical protein